MTKRSVTEQRIWQLSAAMAFLMAIVSGSSAQTLSIRPTGGTQTLYNWEKQRCSEGFIPDSPVRAIRRADSQVLLTSSHKDNWALIGPDFSSLKPSCRLLLSSDDVARQEDTGMLWIQGLFTRNGKEVVALVSEDRALNAKRDGCRVSGTPGSCWLNNILSARSTDMGASFRLLEADRRTAITLGEAYPADAISRFGAFTASNIVEREGAAYVMAWVEGTRAGAGSCLFRNQDPFDAGGWRGWDGKAFTVDMRTPGSGSVCLPLRGLPSEVRSLTFSTKHKLWIAVFASRQKLPGDNAAVPGFYYALSSDLISWRAIYRIMEAPTKPREKQTEYFVSYPSLIDPDSRSRNFDTIDGDSPILTYTVQKLIRGNGSMDRDIKYVRVKINSSP